MNDVYFRAWIANTVHAISGIWPLDWRGSERKRALTYAEISAAACQEEIARKFRIIFTESMRDRRVVSTHKPTIH